ncbi:hypothetical protein Vretifemale_5506, partial [Volvox reticuliferus]
MNVFFGCLERGQSDKEGFGGVGWGSTAFNRVQFRRVLLYSDNLYSSHPPLRTSYTSCDMPLFSPSNRHNPDYHNPDYHNHDYHNHDYHNHDYHNHDYHNHDYHNHDYHNHDYHNHDYHNHRMIAKKGVNLNPSETEALLAAAADITAAAGGDVELPPPSPLPQEEAG